MWTRAKSDASCEDASTGPPYQGLLGIADPDTAGGITYLIWPGKRKVQLGRETTGTPSVIQLLTRGQKLKDGRTDRSRH